MLTGSKKEEVSEVTDYREGTCEYVTVLMMHHHASKDGGNLTLLYFSGMIMSSKRPR
jgi:hypothetical protein